MLQQLSVLCLPFEHSPSIFFILYHSWWIRRWLSFKYFHKIHFCFGIDLASAAHRTDLLNKHLNGNCCDVSLIMIRWVDSAAFVADCHHVYHQVVFSVDLVHERFIRGCSSSYVHQMAVFNLGFPKEYCTFNNLLWWKINGHSRSVL